MKSMTRYNLLWKSKSSDCNWHVYSRYNCSNDSSIGAEAARIVAMRGTGGLKLVKVETKSYFDQSVLMRQEIITTDAIVYI